MTSRHTTNAVGTPRGKTWPSAAVAYIFVVIMLGTTVPTPLYPGYESFLGFGPLVETIVFAVYAAGVLTSLILLGPASDVIGRRPVLLAAIIAATVASVGFLFVTDLHGPEGVALLLLVRVLSGLSGGLVTGTAAAALADLAPPGGHARASLIAAMAQIGGLGLGPLLGGFLDELLPDPLLTVFIVYLALVILGAVFLISIPETVHRAGRVTVRQLISPIPPSAILARADTLGFTGAVGFAVLGLFASVCPTFLSLLGSRSPLLTGAVVCSVFLMSAAGQLLTAKMPAHTSQTVGLALITGGILLVALALLVRSIPLLVISGAVAGAGQGMSFRGCLTIVNVTSVEGQRGETVSSFFVIAYLGISIPVVLVGVASQIFGIVTAGVGFAVVMAFSALLILLLRAKHQHGNKLTSRDT